MADCHAWKPNRLRSASYECGPVTPTYLASYVLVSSPDPTPKKEEKGPGGGVWGRDYIRTCTCTGDFAGVWTSAHAYAYVWTRHSHGAMCWATDKDMMPYICWASFWRAPAPERKGDRARIILLLLLAELHDIECWTAYNSYSGASPSAMLGACTCPIVAHLTDSNLLS